MRMKKLALIAAAAAAFGLWPFAGRLGPVLGSLGLLGLGVLLSLAASATWDTLAAATGALGVLFAALTSTASPALFGAALVGFCYAERTMRVRGSNAQLVHLGSALVAGALAGTLTHAYAGASLEIRVVAAFVAAVLTALPLFVDADDPIAFALEGLAEDVGDDAAASLKEGAALRREVDESLLDASAIKDVRASWKALVRLSEAAARLSIARHKRGSKAAPPSAVAKRVDTRIALHVAALKRAYLAADSAHAAETAEASQDKHALEAVEHAGEKLEAASEVLVA